MKQIVAEKVDMAKVARVRAEIAAGGYVTPEKVDAAADAMIERCFAQEERWRTYRVLLRVVPRAETGEPNWVRMRSEWRTIGGRDYLDALSRFEIRRESVIAVRIGEVVVVPEFRVDEVRP